MVGHTFSIIFPEESRVRAEAQYREIFRGPAVPAPFRSVARRADGEERIVDARPCFLSKDGRRVAMLSVVRDVTPEVTAQQEAAVAKRQQRELLLSLSHDIKSPLAAIRGNAQVLRRHVEHHGDSLSMDRLVGGLGQIELSTLRVSRLLDDLEELAGLELGGAPRVHLAKEDLVPLVGAAVDRYRRLSDGHEIAFEAPPKPIEAWWDGARLERVLDNLLGNAIKYSPAGGRIDVRLEVAAPPEVDSGPERAIVSAVPRDTSGVGALLTLRDEGIGIAQADLPHVFDRFRRGRNVTDGITGSGIGLTNVRHIIEQHRGMLVLESREGKGTAVSMWLPIEIPAGAEARA